MKVLLIIAAAFVALVCALCMVGALLPRKHTASREIALRRAPAEVYAVVRGFENATEWRTDVKKVELLGNVEGLVRFREESRNGSITYELVDDSPGEKLITRIVDRDLGYFGSWSYEFLPGTNGTQVRITEEGEVPNVVFRFIFGHTATMDAYLIALARRFGEDVKPK